MAENLYVQGQIFAGKVQQLLQQWASGEASLKVMLGLNPAELFAIATQGYNLFLQGKTEQARILFEGLIAIDPVNPYYYRALGAVYWRLGDSERAIRQLSGALKLNNKDVAALVARGEIYVSQRNYALAKADLKRAIQLAKAPEQALINKAKAIEKMIQQSPHSPATGQVDKLSRP